MPEALQPGIRETLYIGGFNIGPPDEIGLVFVPGKTKDRTVGGRRLVDRPYAGPLHQTQVNKASLSLKFRATEANLLALAAISSHGDYLDVCVWRPVVESFVAVASATEYFLSRRPATSFLSAPFLPEGVIDVYKPRLWLPGEEPSEILTVGVEGADGYTPVTMAEPLDAGVPFRIVSVPLLRMDLETDQNPYQKPHLEFRSILLEEV